MPAFSTIVAAMDEIMKTVDGGISWQLIADFGVVEPGIRTRGFVAVDAVDGNHVWAVSGRRDDPERPTRTIP